MHVFLVSTCFYRRITSFLSSTGLNIQVQRCMCDFIDQSFFGSVIPMLTEFSLSVKKGVIKWEMWNWTMKKVKIPICFPKSRNSERMAFCVGLTTCGSCPSQPPSLKLDPVPLLNEQLQSQGINAQALIHYRRSIAISFVIWSYLESVS